MLREYIRLAFQVFTAHRMRSFLSVLGIVIGVSSVTAITTLGQSATKSIQSSIEGAGLNTLTLFPGRGNREAARYFNSDLEAALMEEKSYLTETTPKVTENFHVSAKGERISGVSVSAVYETYASIFNYTPQEGLFFTREDCEKRRSVAVLGNEIAGELFPESSGVGEKIKIYTEGKSRSFTVVAVMAPQSDMMGASFDTVVFIPYETFHYRLKKLDNASSYTFSVDDSIDILIAAEEVTEFVEKYTDSTDGIRVISPATIAEMYTSVNRTLNLFLAGVAAISLLVGGIGIMNIMLVSVSERTREIGIRKALGAAPKVIREQFLVESSVLTATGGSIGILIGVTISLIATNRLEWDFSLDLPALTVAVLFSAAVGIFFGLYPAARAAKLDPVEALMSE